TVPCAGLLFLLPRLHTLHTEQYFLPTAILTSGITSLTIGITRSRDRIVTAHGEAHLCQVLRAMPQLRDLTAYGCAVTLIPRGVPGLQFPTTMGDPPSLLHLIHFNGSAYLGLLALAEVPAIEDIRVEAREES
ncbi:hypothetical protein FB451DRAFT_1207850, partial [Mycena latifolia]